MHEMVINRVPLCDGCTPEKHHISIEHQGDITKLSITRKGIGPGDMGTTWKYELTHDQVQEIIGALSLSGFSHNNDTP